VRIFIFGELSFQVCYCNWKNVLLPKKNSKNVLRKIKTTVVSSRNEH